MKPIKFWYTNHRGEVEEREIIPDAIEYIENPIYGYASGWFISGHDLSRNARRSFALTNIIRHPEGPIFELVLSGDTES